MIIVPWVAVRWHAPLQNCERAIVRYIVHTAVNSGALIHIYAWQYGTKYDVIAMICSRHIDDCTYFIQWGASVRVTINVISFGGNNALTPGQNGRQFANDTLKYIFLKEPHRILIKIPSSFVPIGLIKSPRVTGGLIVFGPFPPPSPPPPPFC